MGKNRVLVVEDEVAIANIISLNLNVANYDVRVFHDGLEAVQSLEDDNRYDIALLDIMLPGVDGFGIMEKLKIYDVPVIFLTAKDDISSKVQGLKGGAEDYIVKPFEVLELLIRMEKVLERSNKVAKVINFLDFEINAEEHSIKKNGVEIALKPMEFELFLVLLKNKNIAISREKLLQMVWGTDYFGETRTVDVHIGQIRKKLGISEHIKTISKLGYRLEE